MCEIDKFFKSFKLFVIHFLFRSYPDSRSLSHFSIFRKSCQMQTQTIKGQLRSNIESRSNLTLIQSLISRLRISKVMKNSLAIMTALAINAKNGVRLLKPTFYQLINNSTKNDISCKRKQDTFLYERVFYYFRPAINTISKWALS